IVKKQSVGIRLMGDAEGMLDVVLTDHSQPWRVPQLPDASMLLDRLVYHVPLVNSTGVATRDGADVLLQEFKPLLPGAGPPVGMLPHPARRLRMPHQSVADELHAVLLGKSRLEVRGGEVKPARSRLHRGPFHL